MRWQPACMPTTLCSAGNPNLTSQHLVHQAKVRQVAAHFAVPKSAGWLGRIPPPAGAASVPLDLQGNRARRVGAAAQRKTQRAAAAAAAAAHTNFGTYVCVGQQLLHAIDCIEEGEVDAA